MSYQVLARKWRPGNFDELVGQRQTSQALINALESQRLHHAYLFTGTRGVGKTTIARILSKSLNCEIGITSKPCGTCSSCVEITQGNFVDLLEIDAASKTKVEDTRELLENVQYRPTRGRYKVYLIDEVHMLSGHSFNALLKTLEEPPPHVIFLLATTDPQKLPVTVLSRCLQFHLRRMEESEIINHLSKILLAENIEFEVNALELIAKGADGSMRDALSLLDQAIAYSGDKVIESAVLEMLGSIDRAYAFELLAAICDSDAVKLMQTIQKISEYSPDYDELMSDWLALLHQIAVSQATMIETSVQITQLASQIKPADLQLFYQLSLQARRDLAFAPHPRQGFEMAMLRIIAFKPQSKGAPKDPKKKVKLETSNADQLLIPAEKSDIKVVSEPSPLLKLVVSNELASNEAVDNLLVNELPEKSEIEEQFACVNENFVKKQNDKPNNLENTAEIFSSADTLTKNFIQLNEISQNNWFQFIDSLSITGHGLQVLLNSLGSFSENILTISFFEKVEILLTNIAKETIESEIKNIYPDNQFKILFVPVKELEETPKERISRLHELEIDHAEQKLLSDPQVSYLIQNLDATLPRESIRLKSTV